MSLKPWLYAAPLTLAALAGLTFASAAHAGGNPVALPGSITLYTDVAGFTPAAKAVCPDIDNLLVNSTVGANGPSTTVYGATQEGFGITFTSPSLLTASGGQADIDGPFHQITLTPTDTNRNLQVLEFNVNGAKGTKGSGITLTLYNGDTYTQVLDPGLTFFGLIDTSGQGIKSVSLNSAATLDDIRQVRVCEGACGAPKPGPQPVPEPSSLATMGLGGFGLLGFIVRGVKTRRKQSVPTV